MKTITIEIEIEHLAEGVISDDQPDAVCETATLRLSRTIEDGESTPAAVHALLDEMRHRYDRLNARKTS